MITLTLAGCAKLVKLDVVAPHPRLKAQTEGH
jgi:hypothetical protein